MSDESAGKGKGLFDSLRGLAVGLVAIAHTRIDLLSTELEEERERLVAVLLLLQVALFCLGVGVLLLALLVVVAFWDGYRLAALTGMTGIFLAGGAAAFGFARHKMRTKPKLFAATLAELSKDRQHLTS